MTDFCSLDPNDKERILAAFRSCGDSLTQIAYTGKGFLFDDLGFNNEHVTIDGIKIDMSDVKQAIRVARKARDNSYAPYSHFNVGAAILTPSAVFEGCNIENAAYGSTICAERTAAFNAVSHGERRFSLVGIVGDFDFSVDPKIRRAAQREFIFPCGCCRQVLNEFGGQNLGVVLAKEDDAIFVSLLKYLLPGAFGPESLGVNARAYSRSLPPVAVG